MKEVYQEDKIKEWDPVDPADLEHFLLIVSGKLGRLPKCQPSLHFDNIAASKGPGFLSSYEILLFFR